ncbi:unnamed protein product [Polarella glacialis]|nr:unnamed protein product [Polarella glacialis]
MHLGFGILTGHRDRALSWPERLALVSATYERLTAEAKLRQNIPTIEGLVVGVTDTVQVAAQLGVLNKVMAAEQFLQVLAKAAAQFAAQDNDADLKREEHVLAARILLLQAVISQLLLPSAQIIFRDDFTVTWTAGFFLERAAGQ